MPIHFRCSALMLVLVAALLWTTATAVAQEEESSTGRAGLVIVDGSAAAQHYCVDVDEEATGWDVLVDAGVAVNSEPAAMGNAICAINGTGCSTPRESCFCQCQGSPCVYWSFWKLNEVGEWVYANQGASSAQVRPGEVQAWVWGDGTTGNAPKPPRVTFDDICRNTMISESVISESVISGPTAVSDETNSPITESLITDSLVTETPTTDTQDTRFPWTVLLVLAPLPLILLALLRKR